MSALANLKLVAAKASNKSTPAAQRRTKVLVQLDEQLALAAAQVRGESYAATRTESPRDLRRLQDLREWSYEAIKQVFTRDSGACSVSVQATHLDEPADCLSAKHIIASALDLIIDRAHVYAWSTDVH